MPMAAMRSPSAREVLRGSECHLDLEAPGQVGRTSEELLVEVVPHPPDRLGKQDSGCRSVHHLEAALASPLDEEKAREGAKSHAAPDAEAALPDRDR